MKNKKMSIVCLFMAFSVFSVSADTAELPFIKNMAESNDLKNKKVALSEIDAMIRNESLTESGMREVLSILDFLACEGVVSLRYESFRLDNDYVMVRNEAVRLLGISGHPRALDTLMTVLQYETSTMVLTSAVTACGKIGMTHSKMNTLYTKILKGYKSYYRDDALVCGTLLSVRDIAAINGSAFWSSALRGAIVDVAVPGSGYSRSTRNLAKDVLGEL